MTTLSGVNQSHVDAVSKGEPAWLLQARKDALAKYLELPAEVSPLYSKYSDANRIKPESVHLATAPAKHTIAGDLAKRLEELEKETGILQVGSEAGRVFVKDDVAKKGVIVADIRQALSKYADLVKAHVDENPLDFGEDRYLALETAAFQSGVFVYVPRNVVLDDPIRLITSLADDGTSLVSRNILVAEEGTKATVVQELYAPGAGSGTQQGYFELIETSVKPNAHLEAVTLQAMGADTVCVSNRKAFVERDGKMSWYSGLFGSLLSRYRTDSVMKGAGSSAEDIEIVFGAGNQSFDVTSNLIHNGQHSRGRVQVKSVLKDTSKSLFKGMIKIGKDGKGTESYLSGHAILLDKGAKSDSIPGLEILTNEVRATHSASVAQMDEGQIFYLMTRGLSREGAKREIVSGFLEPLSRKMGPTIRAWVNYLIENKWQGNALMLRTDEAMEQILEVEKSRYRETQDIFEKHYKYR
ncbi:SufD family Fe-S cluster assembly protein [Nitrososphaera sp.]|uniref:SufB/SufD family protein n=1 Tax=Nitrososphaera sp. TaxID=1971748 RepID=UPI001831AEDD|nr:SufD family Fe-S cluster assembly protein [Nitrososphaera sp.]NWG37894.1 SufD family Fe-S cluster assembly protein [Nitrososphaera sp.]